MHVLDDADGAEETRRSVEPAGRRAIVVQADVTDDHRVDRLFDQAIEAFGRVAVPMNNAGVDASGTEVVDLSTEVFDHALRADLVGPFFCCRRHVRARKASGGDGGKIINVTSVHQEITNPGGADDVCSKGALRNLTHVLARELAP